MAEIYFAHPITDYGAEREALGVRTLELVGFQVVNPNTPEHSAGYQEEGMSYFEALVRSCGALAFMRFPEGQIGAGVAKEIGWAHEEDNPIFELSAGGRCISARGIDPRILEPDVLTVDQTRALISEIRSR